MKNPSMLFPPPFTRAVLTFVAAIALPAASAPAAEQTFRHLRFAPTKIVNGGGGMQLSEFTFSRGGTLLNLNNRNGTGVDIVPVTVSAGGQDVNAAEGPGKVVDGQPLVTGGTPNTKWFTGSPLTVPLDFDFGEGTPVTVDAYNFATANDSGAYGNRTPVSWRLLGSHDGIEWQTIDTRSDFPIINANTTYQVGFSLPAAVTPVINSFTFLTEGLSGTAAIVRNNTPVTFIWDTEFGDATGTSLSPQPGAVAASGSETLIPPANATTIYTLTAAKATPPLAATATIPIRSVAGGTATWQFVRFTITKRRPGTNGVVQLSEFELYHELNRIFPVSVTNDGGSNAPDAGEGVNKLIDGTLSKWLDQNNRPVVFDLGSPVPFDGYLFITGNDAPERDPVSWTLEGSNDLVEWTIIENVPYTYPTPTARNTSTLEIPLPGSSLSPVISRFTGDAQTLIAGEPFRLTWDTTLAATVSIDNGVPAVPVSGSVSVSPAADTTYTLTATSSSGFTTTATYFVRVIPAPAITTIAYDNFSTTGTELGLLRNAAIAGTRLRVVPEIQGQSGDAWFRKRQAVAAGFETTFGMSLNQTNPSTSFLAADGLAFVVQNSVTGSGAQAPTGENGLPENALNIKFDTFGTADDASALEVRAGTTVLQRVVLFKEIGVQLFGLFPGQTTFNYTTATNATSRPYQIRIVYVPGSLDIYFDGIAVVQNLAVDLADIGAVSADGTAYVGFTSRTGGNVQNSDITSWHLRPGDFSALPAFGEVKSILHRPTPDAVPNEISLVWNSQVTRSYRITYSTNLTDWEELVPFIFGMDGQSKVRVSTPDLGEKAWFRVEELPEG